MSLDLPKVEYLDDTSAKKEQPKKKNTGIDYEAIRKNEEALKEAKEKRSAREWKKIKLSDLNTNTQTNTD